MCVYLIGQSYVDYIFQLHKNMRLNGVASGKLIYLFNHNIHLRIIP